MNLSPVFKSKRRFWCYKRFNLTFVCTLTVFFSQIWSPTQKNFTLFKVFTRASWQSLLWFVQSWCRVTNSGNYLKRNQTKLENTLTILTFLNKNKVSIKKIWQNNFHGVFEFWLLNDFWLETLKMKDQQNWTVFYYLT